VSKQKQKKQNPVKPIPQKCIHPPTQEDVREVLDQIIPQGYDNRFKYTQEPKRAVK